jgi:hypothetical protein
MAKRLKDRKHSRATTEKVMAAHEPLKHLTIEELDAACQDLKLRQQALAAAPEHIKVIRRLGVIDAARGYTDADLAKWIDAEELARRESDDPEDFVFDGSDSAARSDTSSKQRNRRGPKFQPEEIQNLLRQYMRERSMGEIPSEKTARACEYVADNWCKDQRDRLSQAEADVFPIPSESTIRAQIANIKNIPS